MHRPFIMPHPMVTRFSFFSRYGRGLVLLAGLLLLAPSWAAAEEEGRVLSLENPGFAIRNQTDCPPAPWIFESLELDVDPKTSRARVNIGPKGAARMLPPEKSGNAILRGDSVFARGDLISEPMSLPAFRWVEVTVDYTLLKGDPRAFVCLRPVKDRSLVDLAFLPLKGMGERNRARVRIHTGLHEGDYALALSILGEGEVAYHRVTALETGPYPRPEGAVLVVDMLHVKPPKDGKLSWSNAAKFTEVFGFSEVKHLHFTEVTAEKLREAAPALIVLSPKSEPIGRNEGMRILETLKTVTAHEAPILGICLGHQVLAMSRGGGLGRKAQEDEEGNRTFLSEWGPTMIDIVKDDPIFTGLPRKPRFCASESHRALVTGEIDGAVVLASTEICETQIIKYTGKPWYTFQCHIEREWEFACPEACVLFKNVLRHFFLAP